VDDNARALLVACQSAELLATRGQDFAAFIQHAWNPDTLRFRNFMGYNRHWLEPAGSEDSHGRTLWALGICAAQTHDPLLARWAADLFAKALPTVEGFTSPRAWAFALIGCHAHQTPKTQHLAMQLAERLAALLQTCATSDWQWFEDRLTYDNARICQALILTGQSSGAHHLTDAGLRSLHWLLHIQTAPKGHFRPIGSNGFLLVSRSAPMAFDQQPVEAQATIAACLAAAQTDPAPIWREKAQAAFDWFTGSNDLGLPLVDIATGSCRDGLHPDRANENRGAESVLAWLLSLADMHAFTKLPELSA